MPVKHDKKPVKSGESNLGGRSMKRFMSGFNFNDEVKEEKPKTRKCKIVYMVKGQPQACGGTVSQRKFFERGEVMIGGPPQPPSDTYGVCSKCKVRTDW